MRVPVPDELLPADRLGRVHFVGIGGAGLSGIARIMLARGHHRSPAATPRTPRSCRRCASSARPATSATTPSHVGDADTVVVSTAVREDNPEVRRGRAARGLRILPRSAGARVGDGRAGACVAVAGTHGKTTTTSLLTVALQRLRRRPVVRHRWRPQRDRPQRPRRHRRPLRRRGRRERRRVPRLPPVRRAGHQRRGRPPRQLRHRGGLPRGLRRVRRDRSTPTASWCCCADDPGAARPGRRRAARGLRVVTVGERDDADVRADRPGASTARASTLRRSATAARPLGRVTLQIPGRHYVARRPGRAGRCGLRLGLAVRRSAHAGSRPSPAPAAGWSARARPGACGSTTTTPTTRPRSPATSQAARALAGDGRARRRLPAAPGLAHPDLRRRDGRGARRGRRGGRDRRLRRPRGPRPRASPARLVADAVPLPAEHVALRSRPGRRRRQNSSGSPGPVTWC